MSVKIADEYEYIKKRMEEIKAERTAAPEVVRDDSFWVGGDTQIGEKDTQTQTYMGWDIYPPHNPTSAE